MRTCTMPRDIRSAAEIEHEHETSEVTIGDLSDILDRPDTPGWMEPELPVYSPDELAEMLEDFDVRR